MRRLTVAGLVVLAAASPVHATVWAQAGAQQPVRSATWAAALTDKETARTGPLQLTIPRSARVVPAPVYLDMVNTGTLRLHAATYAIVVGGQREAVLEACTGTWDETTHACSGPVTTVTTSTAGATQSTTIAAEPAGRLRLRVRFDRTLPQDTVVTLEVSVSREDGRPPSTSAG